MNLDDCYELGKIYKPHGLRGEVTIQLDVDNPLEYEDLASVFVEKNGELVPYFISEIKIRENRNIVKFEDVDTLEQAEALAGFRLLLPLENLPTLEEDEFYYFEIIGKTIEDATHGIVGVVRDVWEAGYQDLIVTDHKGAEILIPIIDSIVLSFDRNMGVVHVDLPDGLLETYLNP